MKKWFSASQMSPPSSVPGDSILGMEEKNFDSAGTMAVTSPARLGAPGLVRMALRNVRTAVSSTKVESGN